MTMIIHGSAMSPFVRKVTLIMLEKNIPFEANPINPFSPPADFETLSPLKRIPVLEDDGFTLADSSAIAAYLDAKFPTQGMLPTEAKALGYAMWIEEYSDTVLATDIGLGIFRPALINPMMGKPVDHEAINEAVTNTLPPRFDYLNAQLDNRTWFCDEGVSLADISIYSQMMGLFHTGYLPSAVDYPALMAHFVRYQQRPAAQKLLQSEVAFISEVKASIGVKK